LIYLLPIILLISSKIPQYSNYIQLKQYLDFLKEQKKFEEAIYLLIENSIKFPENDYEISKEIAFLYSKIGKYEKSLEIWAEGHEKGYFFGIFPNFPIYKPFKQFDNFEEIAIVDNQLRKKAIENSQTIHEVIVPENYNPKKIYPLFIILHGGGSSIIQAQKFWITSSN
jgi:tetratricopeptide (TPR) repeat protein